MNTTINLTPFIEVFLSIVFSLVAYRLLPWIKARAGEAQQDRIDAVIRTLVFAAEQIFGAAHGAEKMEYVCEQLRDKGYEVDVSRIEAMVYTQFHKWNDEPPEPVPENTVYFDLDENGNVDVNIEHWSLAQLRAFCQLNDIPCDGCIERDDYYRAIEENGKTE